MSEIIVSSDDSGLQLGKKMVICPVTAGGPKGRDAKYAVIVRPARKLVVAICFPHEKSTDSRTSYIGHWFGMTELSILQSGFFSSVEAYHVDYYKNG